MTNIKTLHAETLWCHAQGVFQNKVIHNKINLYSPAIKNLPKENTPVSKHVSCIICH